jgi:HEAT repeat protein
VTPAPRIAVFTLGCALSWGVVPAQDSTPPPTPEQLAAQERVRPLVNAIWLDVRTPAKPDENHPRYFWEVTDKLIAIGPDVVPFLTSELDLMDPETFHFSAYALGQLGGPDAEQALRKAVRVAEARGGRFGLACKRFAVFGLALLGKPDVMDLMQSEPQSLHGAMMIADFLMMAHLAVLIGPDAAPFLAKQLDTYGSDPAATEKLEDTLLALGRAGDASIVPKLVRLLTHTSPRIRAQAADTISRLGEPALCEKLLPLLASKDQREKVVVASALERSKPEPCYKGMVGRLEVEDELEVRASLYSAIVAMGGESSLDVLRPFLRSSNQFDQVLVVGAIGRIGSKKGLNMLRASVADGSGSTVVRALESIAAIGGEGATDTLLATTSDRRSYVASAAREILTSMGVKKVAPRLAGDLLALVREPVGNLSLRPSIVELTEALITLSYTDPVDDLKAALAVQSDPEIVKTLTSCIRRLQLLAKNGDDAAAWASEAASPFVDVRRLADRRLAEIGSPAAVRALTTRLARNDLPPDERAGILLEIGAARTEGAASLVERHLEDPAYDAWELSHARSAAAWAARRLGGDRMARALRASASRRDGRDWATLVYLAVLEKGDALQTLKTLRVRRLRYPESRFGGEETQLDAIISDLAAGYSLGSFDVRPETLFEL